MPDSRQVQVTSFRTDDFEELQDVSSDWDQQYFRMEPGDFEGQLDLVQIGERHIFRERWNRGFTYRGTTPEGAYAIALPIDRPEGAVWLGTHASDNTALLQAPSREADLVSMGELDVLVLAVPEDEALAIRSALLAGEETGSDFHGTAALPADTVAGIRADSMAFLRQAALAGPDDEERLERWSEQLIKLCLWELDGARGRSGGGVDSSKPAEIVRRATDLVLSDATRLVGLTEICAELNVSLRSLHYAFQDVTGISPATWLRRVRLNRAHKILRQSSPDEVKVKRVAMESGFLHHGHFGQQYQRLFGCLPSDTLRAA